MGRDNLDFSPPPLWVQGGQGWRAGRRGLSGRSGRPRSQWPKGRLGLGLGWAPTPVAPRARRPPPPHLSPAAAAPEGRHRRDWRPPLPRLKPPSPRHRCARRCRAGPPRRQRAQRRRRAADVAPGRRADAPPPGQPASPPRWCAAPSRPASPRALMRRRPVAPSFASRHRPDPSPPCTSGPPLTWGWGASCRAVAARLGRAMPGRDDAVAVGRTGGGRRARLGRTMPGRDDAVVVGGTGVGRRRCCCGRGGDSGRGCRRCCGRAAGSQVGRLR